MMNIRAANNSQLDATPPERRGHCSRRVSESADAVASKTPN